MARQEIVDVVPLSGGIRRTRNADPFFGSPGDLTIAKNGVFTKEGGFLQQGGIEKTLFAAALADGGYPVWMHRWFQGPGNNPFLVLSSNGTLYFATTSPLAASATLAVAQDFTTNPAGVNITGLSSLYFTVAEDSGWLFLAPSDPASDEFYRFDGTKFFQVGAAAPTAGAPGLVAGGAGTMANGTYLVAYTYVYGTNGALGESNASAQGSVAVVAGPNGSIAVTVAASTRTDITAIRIYRSLAGGSILYFDQEVANAAGPHTIVNGDSLLTAANYELETDHDEPPNELRSIIQYRGRLWGVVDDPRNRVHLTLIGQPDVWPAGFEFTTDELNDEMSTTLVGFFSLGERLYATCATGHWVLNGDRNENFYWSHVQESIGYIAERSILVRDGLAWGLGTLDIALFDKMRSVPLTKIRGLVEAIDPELIDDAVATYRKRQYFLAVKTAEPQEYKQIVVVQKDPLPGADQGFAASTIEGEYNPDASDDTLWADFKITTIYSWHHETERLFVGMDDGHVYEFDRGFSFARVGEDAAGADFELQTMWWFPSGPYNYNLFRKIYVAIEDEGAGGSVVVSWEIMTDNLNTLREGEFTVNLTPDLSAGGTLPGIWNVSRWAAA
jgi:hypothetical protein